MLMSRECLPATVSSARLVLTQPTMAHAPAITLLCNNENVHKWMARLPFPYTEADARFFIETLVPSAEECCYAILDKGELVGVVGLHFAPDQPPELGYWVGEPFWGNGYATEAARAVVDAARDAGFSALRSRARATNARSRNVLRKAGFVETGTVTETDSNLAGKDMVLMHLDFAR